MRFFAFTQVVLLKIYELFDAEGRFYLMVQCTYISIEVCMGNSVGTDQASDHWLYLDSQFI